jgi:hypothetical protein
MRHGTAWDDISILDISSRGMCLRGRQVPPRGAYVELRRGRHKIVARVVWAIDQKFGVVAQDLIVIDAVISDPDRAPTNPPAVERRANPRLETRADRSRFVARALQCTVFALIGVASALVAAGLVGDVLGTPLLAVSQALSSG